MRNARRSRKGTLYSADKGFAAGWSQQSCKAGKNAGSAYGRLYSADKGFAAGWSQQSCKAGKNAGSAYGRAYHRNRKANMWCFGGLLKRLIPALNAQAGDCTAEVFFRCVKEEDLQSDLEVFRNQIAAEYEIEIEEILEDEYHRPIVRQASQAKDTALLNPV